MKLLTIRQGEWNYLQYNRVNETTYNMAGCEWNYLQYNRVNETTYNTAGCEWNYLQYNRVSETTYNMAGWVKLLTIQQGEWNYL